MFNKWFWNLLTFSLMVFGVIFASWYVGSFVILKMNSAQDLSDNGGQIILPKQFSYSYATVCFSDNCIDVQIADTKEKQAQGVMFRGGISQTGGFLYVYDYEDKHAFSMQNVSFDTDIVWIDKFRHVAHVERAKSCDSSVCPVYSYEEPVSYVIILASGFAENNNIVFGKTVSIDLRK